MIISFRKYVELREGFRLGFEKLEPRNMFSATPWHPPTLNTHNPNNITPTRVGEVPQRQTKADTGEKPEPPEFSTEKKELSQPEIHRDEHGDFHYEFPEIPENPEQDVRMKHFIQKDVENRFGSDIESITKEGPGRFRVRLRGEEVFNPFFSLFGKNDNFESRKNFGNLV